MARLPAGAKGGPPAEALAAAVTALGGQAGFARFIGIAQPSVWRWLKLRRHLPAEYVEAVSDETGIPMSDLRPDIRWGDTPPTPPALPPITEIEPAR